MYFFINAEISVQSTLEAEAKMGRDVTAMARFLQRARMTDGAASASRLSVDPFARKVRIRETPFSRKIAVDNDLCTMYNVQYCGTRQILSLLRY